MRMMIVYNTPSRIRCFMAQAFRPARTAAEGGEAWVAAPVKTPGPASMTTSPAVASLAGLVPGP